MDKIKYHILFTAIIIGLLFFNLYTCYSIGAHSAATLQEGGWVQESDDNAFHFPLSLGKEAYLLEIRHMSLMDAHKSITADGVNIVPFQEGKSNQIETAWCVLRNTINGDRVLLIKFANFSPPEVQILVRNYVKKIGNYLTVQFKDNHPRKLGIGDYSVSVLLFLVALACAVYFLKTEAMHYRFFRLCLCFTLLPLLLIFILLVAVNILVHSSLLILMNQGFLLLLFIVLGCIPFIMYAFSLDKKLIVYIHSSTIIEFFFGLFCIFLALAGMGCMLGLGTLGEYSCIIAYLFLFCFFIFSMRKARV